MRPAGGDDDGPDPVVVGQLGHRPRQVGPERRTEGVPGGRSVEPEGRDVAVDVDREHVGREAVAHAPVDYRWGPARAPPSVNGRWRCVPPAPDQKPERSESCTRSPPTALPACPDPTGCVVAGRRRSRTSRRCRSRPRRKRSGATRRSTSSTSDGVPPADDRLDDLLATAFVDGVVADVPERAALVVVHNGRPVAIDRGELPESVVVADLAAGSDGLGGSAGAGGSGEAGEALGRVLSGGDALVRLNDAFLPGVLSIDVPSGVVVDRPIVVVHWCGPDASGDGAAPAVFPRTVVRVGDRVEPASSRSSPAPGRERALVVPVVELSADDGANLAYVSLQVLGTGAWHIGRVVARAGRDATVRSFTVGLGAAYDRSRTDAIAAGQGARSELRSAYLGTGEQVHDVRTLQDHAAPHTTSDLLCQGAVAGQSRSVYSGLIRVRRARSARSLLQTNHNLVLDERAHADSVPNLDIEENDVRCSHASTVGPIDEDQRYYLESRGIAPDRPSGSSSRLLRRHRRAFRYRGAARGPGSSSARVTTSAARPDARGGAGRWVSASCAVPEGRARAGQARRFDVGAAHRPRTDRRRLLRHRRPVQPRGLLAGRRGGLGGRVRAGVRAAREHVRSPHRPAVLAAGDEVGAGLRRRRRRRRRRGGAPVNDHVLEIEDLHAVAGRPESSMASA